MDNFEKLLQQELDKLPYEKHVDDGLYNDGQLAGFELGAIWALNYAKSNKVSRSFCRLHTVRKNCRDYRYKKCLCRICPHNIKK